jgi:hypothetical protein
MQLVACGSMFAHGLFNMEIQYSQLKINHLSNTPSTKAAGGGIFSGEIKQGRQGTTQGQEDFELSWYLFFQHYEVHHRRIFFLRVVSRKKEEKSSTNKLPTTRFAIEFFFVLRVAQFKKAKDFFTVKLHTRASTGKPRKPLNPPRKGVCRHKKGS